MNGHEQQAIVSSASKGGTAVNLGYALADWLRELAAGRGRGLTGEARASVRAHLLAHGLNPATRPGVERPARGAA